METENGKHNAKTDVSGNEGNQKLLDDKVAEVAVAFAYWCNKNYTIGLRTGLWYKLGDIEKKYITEDLWQIFKTQKAKATDR